MVIEPTFAVRDWELEARKSQLPGPHSAISGRRYYNPAMGRFLGRDSKQEKGGLHLYGFVGNNSINRWDYMGMGPSLAYGASNTTTGISFGASGNAGTIYPPGSIAATLYGNGALAGTQAYNDEVDVKEAFYGNMGNGHGGGGSANLLSGVSEIAGSSEIYSVGTGNSVSNWESTLSFTKTYVVNGQSYTISNDPHAAPTDGSTAFNVNANTGSYSEIATGTVSIGAIQNLGTVGEVAAPPIDDSTSNYDPDLTADLSNIDQKYNNTIARIENNYNTYINAANPNAFYGLDEYADVVDESVNLGATAIGLEGGVSALVDGAVSLARSGATSARIAFIVARAVAGDIESSSVMESDPSFLYGKPPVSIQVDGPTNVTDPRATLPPPSTPVPGAPPKPGGN